MDFCGSYDKQLAEQHQTFLTTPLLAGWEFRQKPVLLMGNPGLVALAKKQDWDLTEPIRQDLLRDKWAIVVTDTKQIIQYVNPRFEEMTGYTKYETIGRRPDFVQGVKTSPLTRQRIKQALEQQKMVSDRLLNYRKDQTHYWCQVTIRPITNRQKQVVNFIAFEEEVSFDESYSDR